MKRSSIRILSYNIHKGFSFGNTRFLLEEIRYSIRQLDADLVFLQEVVGENSVHHKKIKNWAPQQFEFLADTVWPHYAYGKNAIYSHGHHGNAILSQHPFEAFENTNISHIPTSHRGLLWGKTSMGINLINLHFGLLNYERRKQTQQLCTLINQKTQTDEPLIIAGDFNDWRGQSHKKLLAEQLNLKEAYYEKNHRLARTFPARFPLFAMDRIYYRNLELMDAEILNGKAWRYLSDHCALYAEFKV